MLLLLADWLTGYASAFGVFRYLTLRGILSVLTALAITLLVGPLMIRMLVDNQIGQSVRDDGPKSHLSKAGTPTMGGALILVGIVASVCCVKDTAPTLCGVGDPTLPQPSKKMIFGCCFF